MSVQRVLGLLLYILWVVQANRNCIQRTYPPGSLAVSSFDVIQNFQSGTVKLINPKGGRRYNSFNISLSSQFNLSYDAAISVQNINNFVPANGLDFSLAVSKHPVYLSAIFVMDMAAKWSFASVCFVASARADFAVGTFVANNAQLLQGPPNGSLASIHHHLPHPWTQAADFVYAIPFVSGIRTFDQNMNLSFEEATFDAAANVLSIVVMTSYQKYPLEGLTVSYLIFNMASDLQITSLVNVTSFPPNLNIFLGVSAVSPLSFLPRQNISAPVQVLQISPTQKQAFELVFGVDGIVIQTQQSLDLLYLPMKNGTQQITSYCMSKNKCLSQGGAMLYQQSGVFDISSKCQFCMKNAIYDQTLDTCVCQPGFITHNTSCINATELCSENQTFSHQQKKCVCKNLHIRVNKTCILILDICIQGEIYFQGKCIKIVYSTLATTLPTCQAGFIMINKTCVAKKECKAPLILNNQTNECVCPKDTQLVANSCVPCTTNQTWVNFACKCKDGYFRIDKKCLLCNTNAYYNGATCVCLRNYQGDGFNCSPTNLAQNQQPDKLPKGTYFGTGGVVSLSPP